MIIVLVSGGFDPLHSGHIAYFEHAKKLGDKLIVGINSDNWLIRKKGSAFMPWYEREAIVRSMEVVDNTISFNDDDDTAIDAIREVKKYYDDCEIIFANGGDRTPANIPEAIAFNDDPTVTFAYGIGGSNKKNSSSWILDEWKAPKTEREWGYYRVLYECPGYKVKLLSVDPGKSLSCQKHQYRSEYWFVSDGKATVLTDNNKYINLEKFDQIEIPQKSWHKLENNTKKTLDIIEIQYGEMCVEEDITRKQLRTFSVVGKLISNKQVYVSIIFDGIPLKHIPVTNQETGEVGDIISFSIPYTLKTGTIPISIVIENANETDAEIHIMKFKCNRPLRYGVMSNNLHDIFTNTDDSDGKNNVVVDGTNVYISNEQWEPYLHKTEIRTEDWTSATKINRGDWVHKFSNAFSCDLSITGDYGIDSINPTDMDGKGITKDGESFFMNNFIL